MGDVLADPNELAPNGIPANAPPLPWIRLCQIGSGGQATVTKIQCANNKVYALKELHKDNAYEREKEILEEVAKTNKLGEHVRIVTPVDIILTPTVERTLVFPFYSDGDLFTHVMDIENVMMEKDVAVMLCKLSSAVAHLHHNGIVHQDIKPENILLQKNDQKEFEPLLTDFGYACVVDNLDQWYTVNATDQDKNPGSVYIAPEAYKTWGQILGSLPVPAPHYYVRARDVWSLGMCAFTMRTKKFPFRACNYFAYCNAARGGSVLLNPSSRASLSHDFLNIVDACLQVYPHGRPTAEELRLAWESASQLTRS